MTSLRNKQASSPATVLSLARRAGRGAIPDLLTRCRKFHARLLTHARPETSACGLT